MKDTFKVAAVIAAGILMAKIIESVVELTADIIVRKFFTKKEGEDSNSN